MPIPSWKWGVDDEDNEVVGPPAPTSPTHPANVPGDQTGGSSRGSSQSSQEQVEPIVQSREQVISGMSAGSGFLPEFVKTAQERRQLEQLRDSIDINARYRYTDESGNTQIVSGSDLKGIIQEQINRNVEGSRGMIVAGAGATGATKSFIEQTRGMPSGTRYEVFPSGEVRPEMRFVSPENKIAYFQQHGMITDPQTGRSYTWDEYKRQNPAAYLTVDRSGNVSITMDYTRWNRERYAQAPPVVGAVSGGLARVMGGLANPEYIIETVGRGGTGEDIIARWEYDQQQRIDQRGYWSLSPEIKWGKGLFGILPSVDSGIIAGTPIMTYVALPAAGGKLLGSAIRGINYTVGQIARYTPEKVVKVLSGAKGGIATAGAIGGGLLITETTVPHLYTTAEVYPEKFLGEVGKVATQLVSFGIGMKSAYEWEPVRGYHRKGDVIYSRKFLTEFRGKPRLGYGPLEPIGESPGGIVKVVSPTPSDARTWEFVTEKVLRTQIGKMPSWEPNLGYGEVGGKYSSIYDIRPVEDGLTVYWNDVARIETGYGWQPKTGTAWVQRPLVPIKPSFITPYKKPITEIIPVWDKKTIEQMKADVNTYLEFTEIANKSINNDIDYLKARKTIIESGKYSIEPQMFKALKILEDKGYKTISSGFQYGGYEWEKPRLTQHITFENIIPRETINIAKKMGFDVTGETIYPEEYTAIWGPRATTEIELSQMGRSLNDVEKKFIDFANKAPIVEPISTKSLARIPLEKGGSSLHYFDRILGYKIKTSDGLSYKKGFVQPKTGLEKPITEIKDLDELFDVYRKGKITTGEYQEQRDFIREMNEPFEKTYPKKTIKSLEPYKINIRMDATPQGALSYEWEGYKQIAGGEGWQPKTGTAWKRNWLSTKVWPKITEYKQPLKPIQYGKYGLPYKSLLDFPMILESGSFTTTEGMVKTRKKPITLKELKDKGILSSEEGGVGGTIQGQKQVSVLEMEPPKQIQKIEQDVIRETERISDTGKLSKQKQRSIRHPEYGLKSDMNLGQERLSIYHPLYGMKQEQELGSLQGLQSLQGMKQDERQLLGMASIQLLDQGQSQTSASLSKFDNYLNQIYKPVYQKQKIKIIEPIIPTVKIPPPPEEIKIPPPKTPGGGLPERKEDDFFGLEYNSYFVEYIPRQYKDGKRIRQKTWRKIINKPLNRLDAMSLGADFVGGNPRASFRLVGSEKKPQRLRKKIKSFNQVSEQYYQKPGDVFVELPSYRIDSKGELMGITKRGIEARRRGKGNKKRRKRKR